MSTSRRRTGSVTPLDPTGAPGRAGAPSSSPAAPTAHGSDAVPSRWTRARLIQPSDAGYLYLGASSGPWRIPLALPRTRRRKALSLLRTAAAQLRHDERVQTAAVFRGLLRPPGARSLPGQNADAAAYDAVLLVCTTDPAAAAALRHSEPVTELLADLEAAGATTLAFAATNARRMADVDHDRPGVFLFNYFTAEDVETNLHAWQYTAGWFQDQTGLDNSTVLRPADPAGGYSLVNHCRWDRLRDVLPALVFYPSFRTFVLRAFAEHRTAPHPVLYRLDR